MNTIAKRQTKESKEFENNIMIIDKMNPFKVGDYVRWVRSLENYESYEGEHYSKIFPTIHRVVSIDREWLGIECNARNDKVSSGEHTWWNYKMFEKVNSIQFIKEE